MRPNDQHLVVLGLDQQDNTHTVRSSDAQPRKEDARFGNLGLFGEVTHVFTHAATHIPERIDERGQAYPCTADDSAYALFKTKTGVVCQFNSSWNTRVRRDDLLTMQVDGTTGSAIVGLRKCWTQHAAATPKAKSATRPSW